VWHQPVEKAQSSEALQLVAIGAYTEALYQESYYFLVDFKFPGKIKTKVGLKQDACWFPLDYFNAS